MNEELISVIIPVYNTSEYLSKCLLSVINNSFKNLEIICINDGSTDNSLSVLEELSKKDNRIKIISIHNSGVSHARNVGLDYCTGDYIAFVDSDDEVHPDYFLVLFHFLKKLNADIVSCGFLREIGLGKDKIDIDSIEYDCVSKDALLDDSSIKGHVWGKIYTRKSIGAVRFDENIQISEDKVFNIELFSKKDSIMAISLNCKLYYYIYRSESALQKSNYLNYLRLGKKFYNLAKHSNDVSYQKMMLNEAFINTFSGRYGAMFIDNKELKRSINMQVKECLRLERQQKCFEFKRSLRLRMMARIPLIYRMFRILNDRTMIDWERKQRKHQKNII